MVLFQWVDYDCTLINNYLMSFEWSLMRINCSCKCLIWIGIYLDLILWKRKQTWCKNEKNLEFFIMKFRLLSTVLEMFLRTFFFFLIERNIKMLRKSCCMTVYFLYIILFFTMKSLKQILLVDLSKRENSSVCIWEKKDLSCDVIITHCWHK